MEHKFDGWESVANLLVKRANEQESLSCDSEKEKARLNFGQRASLRAVASRIGNNGIVIADEVGMGKTRIAVNIAKSVIDCGGRVAILVPPGLGYQWQTELQDGGLIDVPPILRSVTGYLGAWAEGRKPWFNESIVLVSHSLANWRLGESTHPKRWAIVAEVYAAWRREMDGRLPRNYRSHTVLKKGWPSVVAAESIVRAVRDGKSRRIHKKLDQLLEEVRWPEPTVASNYSKDGQLRNWLKTIVGIGLGVFDLVIIDEAHKNRRKESGLSNLIDNLIMSSKTTRRLSLTATPVELDVSQWENTLKRLALSPDMLSEVKKASENYAASVKRLRQCWQTCEDARSEYIVAAKQFETILSPYLLRRDKREDPDVIRFSERSNQPINSYRRQIELAVDTNSLSLAWRRTVCAAEALSVVTRQADDPVSQRLRLTIGNGHGITAVLDQLNRTQADEKQESFDANEGSDKTGSQTIAGQADPKRTERARWWLDTISKAFENSDTSLFEHPAILAAVEAIEGMTNSKEKVLVFGRFTRPMRALVNLLNAREMLRTIEAGRYWPQKKVHEATGKDADESELPAVVAAKCQLNIELSIGDINRKLKTAYDREQYRRQVFSERLFDVIRQGLTENNRDEGAIAELLSAFQESNEGRSSTENRPVTLVAKAILDQLGVAPEDVKPSECARVFAEIVAAASDRDSADLDSDLDNEQAAALWQNIEGKLDEEYNRPQGGFARLMYGGTTPESRRMIQLAFNRPNSFPRVLVAQSLVGREGLNLHKACSTVILLHPEWNPGVVEQQIGRVDRVGSHWCKKLDNAIKENKSADELPRIEIRPIIFRGTYDEWNWEVLKTRWDNLRAQLHGVVITDTGIDDPVTRQLMDELESQAPNFSPTKAEH